MTAASLLMPAGATPERLRNLARRDERHGPAGEAIHNLLRMEIIERCDTGGEKQLRPTQIFMKLLLDEDSPPMPKLLAATQSIYEGFTFESLHPFITNPDVLDKSPLG